MIICSEISENSDMSDADVYSVNTNEIEIYNLKIAKTYYWTVAINGKESEIKSFSTCTNAPRNLYVDGVTNVRDFGRLGNRRRHKNKSEPYFSLRQAE